MRLKEIIDCGIKKIISKPWLAFTFLFVISIFFANHIDKFELDASSDSLLLEND